MDRNWIELMIFTMIIAGDVKFLLVMITMIWRWYLLELLLEMYNSSKRRYAYEYEALKMK